MVLTPDPEGRRVLRDGISSGGDDGEPEGVQSDRDEAGRRRARAPSAGEEGAEPHGEEERWGGHERRPGTQRRRAADLAAIVVPCGGAGSAAATDSDGRSGRSPVRFVSGWAALALLAWCLAPRALLASGSPFADCEALLAAAPRGQDGPKCFWETARREGWQEEAARRLAAQVAQDPGAPWPHFYLGNLAWSEPERAEGLYRTAADLFQAGGDAYGEVHARSNLYLVLFLQGRMDEAGPEASRMLEVAQRAGDPQLIARAKITLGRYLHESGGDLQRAVRLLSQAAAAVFPESSYDLQRDWLLASANLALELGRRPEARAAYRRMLALTVEHQDAYAESTARYGLAQVAFDEMAELPEEHAVRLARELASQALEAAGEARHTGNEAHALHLLGMIERGPAATKHLERCLAVAPADRARSYCLHALTRHLAASDPAAARTALDRAFDFARRTEDPWSLTLCWRAGMHLAWASAAPDAAYDEGLAALDAIETLRDEQRNETGRTELFSTWVEDYHWLSGRLLQEWKKSPDPALLARAFAVTERMRARTLLEALQIPRTGGPAPAPAAVGMRQRIDTGFATLAAVQRALAPDQALLSFQVAPEWNAAGQFAGGAWLVAVTRQRTRAYPIGGRVELRPRIAMFNDRIPRRDGKEGRPAQKLYGLLLARAVADLPSTTTRLVLVPDDDLHRLPFAVLRPAPAGPLLGTSYELTVVPSATLWLLWRNRPAAAAARPALAMADPPSLAAGRHPWRGAGPTERGGTSFASALELPPLPYARREARAVAHHFARGAVLRVGEKASEAYLKRHARRFGIVHFATHAVVDDATAGRAGVLLAPDGADDGVLETREIAALDLTGATVVLASCRSASGQVLRGEGVVGLARAFFQAGAQAVVASLWPLRDEEAQVLFASFYRHLGEGRTLTAALRAAQAERIAAGAPAAAWAGLVVLGDGELAPGRLPRRRVAAETCALVLLAAALSAAVVLALRRRR